MVRRPGTTLFPTRPVGPGDPEKFAGAARRLGPEISIAAPAPLPSASPWRLLEVGGGKQTQRKAKYYECSRGDFRGGRGPEGMSRSQRQRPTTKGRVRGGERSLHGASPPLCESWTILLPRGAEVSNISPAATPFLSPPARPLSHPSSSGF